MSQLQVKTFDDVPLVPLCKILRYLDIKDLFRMRAVSRKYKFIIENEIEVQTLCYSNRQRIEHIPRWGRWVSGAFAQNFVGSPQFAAPFFNKTLLCQKILSTLKHLRLIKVEETEKENKTNFAYIFNSLNQLKQLDIILATCNQLQEFRLNLPMLTGLKFDHVSGIEKLTLDTPKLREVQLVECAHLKVKFISGESIERLLVDCWEYTEVKKLSNLQCLYVRHLLNLNPTLLSSLQQLKEIHTHSKKNISELFEQKEKFGRTDLKIYLGGWLLDGLSDPAIDAFDAYHLPPKWLVCFAENPSRLADQIPFYLSLPFSDIEHIAPDLQINILKRFTGLHDILVDLPVQNVQSFLSVPENFKNIIDLKLISRQPQPLYDQLPKHSTAVKWLEINNPFTDLAFLFRLKHLKHLEINWPINGEVVRKVLEELPVLTYFWFMFIDLEEASIRINHYNPKDFSIFVKRQKIFVTDDPRKMSGLVKVWNDLKEAKFERMVYNDCKKLRRN